jgi:hypothetical protein
LKNVARIQDEQRAEDIEADAPKLAPSLRRHETVYSPQVADDDDDDDPVEVQPKVIGPGDESLEEEDLQPVADQVDSEIDEWFDEKPESEENNLEAVVIAGQGQLPKKKKKGDGLRDVIVALRKNLPQAGGNSKLDINLVTKVPPPIPAPKGSKKPRPLCVLFTSWRKYPADLTFSRQLLTPKR